MASTTTTRISRMLHLRSRWSSSKRGNNTTPAIDALLLAVFQQLPAQSLIAHLSQCPRLTPNFFFRFEDLQAEFEEFQLSSRELENELETQLANHEKRIRDLEGKNHHLLNENEVLRSRFERISTESRSQLNDLTKQCEEVSADNEQLRNHIRDLEQSNDDLDRAKRHLDATLAEFDTKLNEQIERNELLESEIGEKEDLQVVIQRLKDEANDLRLELTIQQCSKSPTTTTPSSKRSAFGDSEANNSSPTATKPKTAPTNVNSSVNLTNGTAQENSKSYSNNVNSSPNYNTPKQSPNQIPLLSASSRISALNIVSDLLRKVGALESKLASCRNIVPVSASLMKNSASIKGSTTNNNVDTNSSVNSSLKDINANV